MNNESVGILEKHSIEREAKLGRQNNAQEKAQRLAIYLFTYLLNQQCPNSLSNAKKNIVMRMAKTDSLI